MTDALANLAEKNISIGKFRLAETGLVVDGDPTYEEWEMCGEFLKQAEKAVQFWIGDWLNYGEKHYGETYTQALEATDNEYQTLANYKYVAGSVEFSRRRENLSFSHHAEVAQLPAERQEELLTKASEENLSVRELRQEVSQARTQIAMLEPAIRPPKYHVEDGQVWHMGRHTLVCGDAYKLIGNIQGNALITDPPYGIDYKPDWNKWDGSASDFSPVYGDDKPFDPVPFLNFSTVTLFGANYYSNLLPMGGWLCWDKRTNEELDKMFGSPFELAWYRSMNTTRKAIMVRLLHGGVVNADSVNGNNEKRYHATQKPVALMETVIRQLTREGETVIDPFAGSGSTLLACERSNRNCIAIEIDPNNAAIIIQRWVDETGGVPCSE